MKGLYLSHACEYVIKNFYTPATMDVPKPNIDSDLTTYDGQRMIKNLKPSQSTWWGGAFLCLPRVPATLARSSNQ